MSYPRTPHAWNCDCIGCENLRDEGLPTDGRCFECQAPHNAPHRDGCSGQFGESNAIRVLAAPVADHPDHREEWRSGGVMSDDLIGFLRARLNEDEQAALSFEVSASMWLCHHCGGAMDSAVRLDGHLFECGHREWGPARMLAEVEVKRRLLNLHVPKPMWVSQDACTECSGCGCCPQEHPCPTVQILALAYVDHPEYRAEWRPAAE